MTEADIELAAAQKMHDEAHAMLAAERNANTGIAANIAFARLSVARAAVLASPGTTPIPNPGTQNK